MDDKEKIDNKANDKNKLEDNKNKFLTLTPLVLEQNEKIYNDFLDYAFERSDVKNIAITGVYGSGKTTVWKTFLENKKNNKEKKKKAKNLLNNTITVSLGNYNSDSDDSSASLEERLERQIINQIVSQVNEKKIYLSKFLFKKNKSKLEIASRVIFAMFFVLSNLLLIFTDGIKQLLPFLNNWIFFLIVIPMMVIPVFLALWHFFKYYRFIFSKLKFKYVEADVKEEKHDEIPLEKDIKELVYIIYNSKTKVIVFEDIDRFDNNEVFQRLKKLNTLLNSYLETKQKRKWCNKKRESSDNREVVKFVYLLRSGIFEEAKDRTKFFDVIIPIVRVIDSNSSKDKLFQLFKKEIDKSALLKISYYIDDYRLLKNISNEYLVYSDRVKIKELNLKKEKLFALIVLKNLFPLEFDELQQNRGYIFQVFQKLENKRENKITEINNEIKRIEEKIQENEELYENKIVEFVASETKAQIPMNEIKEENWEKFLKNWSLNAEKKHKVNYYEDKSFYINYNEFFSEFILSDPENEKKIRIFFVEKEKKKSELLNKIKDKKEEIVKIRNLNYPEIFSELTSSLDEEVFKLEKENKLQNNQSAGFIKMIILESLLDRSYEFYMTDISSEFISSNDSSFIKSLMEQNKINLFLELKDFDTIKMQLNITDYRKEAILNVHFLNYLIENNFELEVFEICKLISERNLWNYLEEILKFYKFDLIHKFIEIVIQKELKLFFEILNYFKENNLILYKDILISLWITKNIKNGRIFENYLSNNEKLIDQIPEKYEEQFIKNFRTWKIKLKNLSEINDSSKYISLINEFSSFENTILNHYLNAKRILNKEIKYSNLLSEIKDSEKLKAAWREIERNFGNFASQYILIPSDKVIFNNNEDILWKILDPTNKVKNRSKYIENNKTIIFDFNKLKRIQENWVFQKLIKFNLIAFTSENLNVIYDKFNNSIYDWVIHYLEFNEKNKDFKTVLESTRKDFSFVLEQIYISDNLFSLILENSYNTAIKKISNKLPEDRTIKLAKNNLIEINEYNIKMLVKWDYYDTLKILITQSTIEQECAIVSWIFEDNESNLIPLDKLLTILRDEDNIERLISKLGDNFSIELLEGKDENIIKNAIENHLNDKSIEYIIKNFNSFEWKDLFIKKIDEEQKLHSKLKDQDKIIDYIISNTDFEDRIKKECVILEIEQQTSIEQLKEHIKKIPSISELSKIWENRYPIIEENMKEVADKLVQYGYAKIINKKNSEEKKIKKNINKQAD